MLNDCLLAALVSKSMILDFSLPRTLVQQMNSELYYLIR